MPDSYGFVGDSVTFLGLIGVASTAIILVTIFRSFYNSSLNK